jgi:ribosomal protein S18 acetylase RimI-like enzyme
MKIRYATPHDADLLAKHRAMVWHEVGEWSMIDLTPQIPIWTEFFRKCLRDETYVAFVAEETTTVVASGGILIHLTIPRPGSSSERAGRVQSVYVIPDSRRNGIARAVMERILSYAREATLVSLSLHPSNEARKLYGGLGFVAADEMLIRFSDR